MPTDETRRLLRIFGVAITNYEDAVQEGAPPEKLKQAEAEARMRLQQIQTLIERLSSTMK